MPNHIVYGLQLVKHYSAESAKIPRCCNVKDFSSQIQQGSKIGHFKFASITVRGCWLVRARRLFAMSA